MRTVYSTSTGRNSPASMPRCKTRVNSARTRATTSSKKNRAACGKFEASARISLGSPVTRDSFIALHQSYRSSTNRSRDVPSNVSTRCSERSMKGTMFSRTAALNSSSLEPKAL